MISTVSLARGLVFVIVVGALSAAPVAAGDAEAANIIRNGDFESGADGKDEPAVWRATRVPHTSEHVAFDWDDQVFHSGGRSASISIDESHPDDQIHYNWNQHVFGFEPGNTYLVTGWVKTRDLTSSAFIVVQCWNQEMTEVLGSGSNQDIDEVAGTSDWVQVKTAVEVPEGARRMVILVGTAAPINCGGKVWFDDIRIVPEVSD